MCGIVGFTGKDRAVPYLLDCLSKLEYRGYDSAGIALLNEKHIDVTKCAGKLSVLTSVLASKKKDNSSCGIGHTRWATHGKPSEKNAHPHLSPNGVFAVVHNGIIENYARLRQELTEKGYIFRSETDTEVIAYLLEKNYDGDFLTAVRKTVDRLEGSFAIAVLCRDYPGKIFCYRWGSPLVLAKNEKGCFISSDVTSLLKYSNEVFRLGGGESALADEETVEFFDKEMKRIEKKAEKITWTVADAEKSGFEHFMLKEIFEQSETVQKTLSEYVNGNDIVFPKMEKIFDTTEKIKRILFIGCGSAYNVGLTAKYVTEKLTGIYCSAEIASEWRYSDSPVSEDCLAVFISQSGETADTLAALRKAKKAGAMTLGIVNVISSSVACESDCVLYTRAGPEIAVATTKAYTAQLVLAYLLALKIGKLYGKIEDEIYLSFLSEIKNAPSGISLLLERLSAKAEKLADELFTSRQIYFIGRNTGYATAMEGALKLKEISYIPCEAYAAGELKHGTISLIEKGTPVVALLGNRELSMKTLSNIKEVKSRGARVIGVADSVTLDGEAIDEFDRLLEIPACKHGIFSGIYESIALQLFAYYMAKKRDCDIDKPRNLAKSVTVE